MKHFPLFVALVVAGCCSNPGDQMVLRRGMDYNKANDMVMSVGADQPAILKTLPHEILAPGYTMQMYRLPSGTVIQVYGEIREGNTVVLMMGVFPYRPAYWNWSSKDDPELAKMIESGRSGVHEYDLRSELMHNTHSAI